MLPSMFIAHGSPLLAIEDNEYTQFLRGLGETLKRPRAVILFSAHYVAPVQQVGAANEYETIYDFGGFPDALYQIKYPAKGARAVADEIAAHFAANGIRYEFDSARGLDHGAWVVLRLLFPEADIPVVSMSVNPRLAPTEQYSIGKSLRSLREKDILLVASGGTVHNLRALQWNEEGANGSAVQFDDWLASRMEAWDLASLFDYRKLAPHADYAVPPYGNEHFIPLFYAMGAADDAKSARLLHRSYRYGSLSHTLWQFG